MQNSKIFPVTIPQTPVLGERKVCFRSPKMYQNSPTAMQNSNIFPGTILRTPVLGERKVCFCSPKMYQSSPSAMQNSKIFPSTIPRIPISGERKVCFRSPKMYQKSPTAMQNSKKKSGGRTTGPPFLGRGGKSCLLLKLCLATPLTVWPPGKTEMTSLSTSSKLIGFSKEARSADRSRVGEGSLGPLPSKSFDFHIKLMNWCILKQIISWINFLHLCCRCNSYTGIISWLR